MFQNVKLRSRKKPERVFRSMAEIDAAFFPELAKEEQRKRRNPPPSKDPDSVLLIRINGKSVTIITRSPWTKRDLKQFRAYIDGMIDRMEN